MPSHAPLAVQLRPQTLDEVAGQTHLIGPDKPLRLAVERQQLFSMIFWGPPGVGKTTLARILASQTGHPFIELSAVSAGKADVKQIIADTTQSPTATAPVLFLDEIHRFNKAQQDYLLPFVEQGTIILIGATTENPSFEVIPALLSRSRVYVLESLSEVGLNALIDRSITALAADTQPATDAAPATVDEATRSWLIQFANGDARQLLTLIDTSWQLYGDLSLEHLQASLESPHLRYDQTGEEHYNTISAFIKSMRASNPDAALYYLARMVAAGEDPKFIARRMVIFASEDIGVAQPTALVVANAVFDAVTKIGYPEAQINLAHGAVYLSLAKKNRSAYDAYFAALADVEKHGNLPIPLELRNAPTKFMKKLGYGQGYQPYPPRDASLLPKKLSSRKYLNLD